MNSILGSITVALNTSFKSVLPDGTPPPSRRLMVGDVLKIRALGRAISGGVGDVTPTCLFGNAGDLLTGVVLSVSNWGGGGSWVMDLSAIVQLKAGQTYQPQSGTAYTIQASGTFIGPAGNVVSINTAFDIDDGPLLLSLLDFQFKSTQSSGDSVILDVFDVSV